MLTQLDDASRVFFISLISLIKKSLRWFTTSELKVTSRVCLTLVLRPLIIALHAEQDWNDESRGKKRALRHQQNRTYMRVTWKCKIVSVRTVCVFLRCASVVRACGIYRCSGGWSRNRGRRWVAAWPLCSWWCPSLGRSKGCCPWLRRFPLGRQGWRSSRCTPTCRSSPAGHRSRIKQAPGG